jgi:hypothetical protein
MCIIACALTRWLDDNVLGNEAMRFLTRLVSYLRNLVFCRLFSAPSAIRRARASANELAKTCNKEGDEEKDSVWIGQMMTGADCMRQGTAGADRTSQDPALGLRLVVLLAALS